MKRIRWWLLLAGVLLVLVPGGYLYVAPRLPVMTGYAAKNMCSCVFVSERSPEEVQATDLAFFPVQYTRSGVNLAEKSVTTTILGMSARKAVFREGMGCTLLPDAAAGATISRPEVSDMALPLAPDLVAWPAGDRLSDTFPSGVDRERLAAAVAAAFDPPEGLPEKRTRAVLVVYRGQIVAEAYAPGFDQQTRLLGWSMTKSIIHALCGILVGEGSLSLNEAVALSEWKGDERRMITLDQLLHMSSGLSWNEGYGDLSDVTRMLYLSPNVSAYAIEQALEFPPGTEWEYSSGTTNIISSIIRRTITDDPAYWSFARERLFNQIGMRSALIEPDAAGNLVGSSYGWATARDWARFGLLYLNDGEWLGRRILPQGWVDYARQEAPASGGEYGAHFWLNRSGKLPDAPRDMFVCQGFQGQRIFILPTQELVVVRLGLADADVFDFNAFLGGVLGAF